MRIFFLLIISLFALDVRSQVVEDFESTTLGTIPVGWSQISLASDGGYEVTSDISGLNFFVPSHTNYVGTSDGVCNCNKSNEQLISSPVNIPLTGVTHVQFEYILGDLNGEFARFGISLDGGSTIIDMGVLNSTNVPPIQQSDWSKIIFSLTGYEGQTVNFVWTYDDNNAWSSGLAIDDLELVNIPLVDMEMTELTHIPIVAQGSVTVSGIVRNLGSDPVSAYEVIWDAGAGPQSYIVTPATPLEFDDYDEFFHSIPLSVLAGDVYNLEVNVNVLNDANSLNDTLTGLVSVVTSVPHKVVVGEDRTGEWCGWCPRSAKYLAEMELSNVYDFIGIAIHNQDPMAVAAYDNGIDAYIPNGLPMSGVDRVITGDPSEFAFMHAQRVGVIAPAELYVQHTFDGTDVDVDISCEFKVDLTGDYRLGVVLVEDNVMGKQVNYYNSGTPQLTMPDIGSMANYDFSAGPDTVVPFYHDYVARAVGGNDINGEFGSLPQSVVSGQVYTYSYTIPQNSNWNMSNVRAVAMLINGATGEILNAQGQLSILSADEEYLNAVEIQVIPNPTEGVSQLIMELEEVSTIQVSIANSMGEEVLVFREMNLPAGSYLRLLDLNKLAQGVYFATVIVNDSVEKRKINVVK